MSDNGEFSEEQSEELISHLKSSGRSEFEQLRSTLNLLAHVTELPPTSVPPVLPSGITQPIPLIPVKSTKPRRTVVTSVIVVGILASASLAAAAVTGIGPSPIVNIGHQTAKFVKGVAGAVSHVVTGGNAETVEKRPVTPQIPGLTSAPTGGEDSSSNNSKNSEGSSDESLNVQLPLVPNILTPEARQSNEGKDSNTKVGKNGSGKEGKTNSNENQSSNSDSSSSLTLTLSPSPTLSPTGEKEQSDSEGQKAPESSKTTRPPSAFPSPNPSDQSSDDE
jgi:hypothetical protein